MKLSSTFPLHECVPDSNCKLYTTDVKFNLKGSTKSLRTSLKRSGHTISFDSSHAWRALLCARQFDFVICVEMCNLMKTVTVSAGPDGIAGTDDDVKVHFS